jgi:hypothetical protein
MADGKPNRHRGEIAAELDGRQWNLCLTLGALAELETHFGVADLGDLAGKLGSGRLSAGQMTAILAAGLRGGGHDVSDAEAARMRCGDGIAGMARIVADLVAVTFGAGGEATKVSGQPPNPTPPREGG